MASVFEYFCASDLGAFVVYSCNWIKKRPYLYLLSRRGPSLRGGREPSGSESDSDTGLRGREEVEEAGAVQLRATGEDLGLGRVETPDRDLLKE